MSSAVAVSRHALFTRGEKCLAEIVERIGSQHRLQLSRNLRDSPGFTPSVPDHGRPYHCCIVCPGCQSGIMLCMVIHTVLVIGLQECAICALCACTNC